MFLVVSACPWATGTEPSSPLAGLLGLVKKRGEPLSVETSTGTASWIFSPSGIRARTVLPVSPSRRCSKAYFPSSALRQRVSHSQTKPLAQPAQLRQSPSPTADRSQRRFQRQ